MVSDKIIQTAVDASIQQRASVDDAYGGPSILHWLAYAGEIVPAWWSRRRDHELRRFVKSNDYLSSALYAVQTKVTTLPWQVIPKDMSVRAQRRQADQAEAMLHSADFGDGWTVAISKFLDDVLTCDNGGFLEVIGDGDPSGPIVGPALGIAHLDSTRCWRTSSPEYPVLYEDTSGRLYRLHRARVISLAQMPSPQVEMRGVGFGAVSRAVNVGQRMADISLYFQEKLGSRPARQLIVANGISADEVVDAFRIAEMQMDNAGLNRYAKNVVIGAKNKEIRLDVKDLASVPDGFDEEKAITLGMFTIALAFGVDARELWPASASGATKADAMLQHLKARGKTIGWLTGQLARLIGYKALPPTLDLVFDEQDDEQDMQRAEINDMRAKARTQNLTSGATTVRVERERMLDDGELTDAQFEDMELADGRLPDGQSVLTLFQSPDPRMQMYLAGITPDTTDPALLTEAMRKLEALRFSAANSAMLTEINQALAALRFLRDGQPDETETDADEGSAEKETEDEEQDSELPAMETKALPYSRVETDAMLVAAARILSRGE